MHIIRLTPALEECLFFHGLVLFNTRCYFLAHETWETCWRGMGPGPKRVMYHALIQCAVALAHHEHGNAAGVAKMRQIYRPKLRALPDTFMGLDLGGLLRDVENFLDTPPTAAPSVTPGQPVPPTLQLLHDPFASGAAARLDVKLPEGNWRRACPTTPDSPPSVQTPNPPPNT